MKLSEPWILKVDRTMSCDYKPMSFETPWSFREIIEVKDLRIEYKQMTEVCQGGPCIGNLYINGVEVGTLSQKNYKGPLFFGGPLLINNECLYVPLFERNISGFRLFCWNLTNKTYLIGIEELPLIILDKIDDSNLHYSIGNKLSDKRVINISEINSHMLYPKTAFFSLKNISILILLLIILVQLLFRR